MKKLFWTGWRKFATLAILSPVVLLTLAAISLKWIYPPEKIRQSAMDFLGSRLERPVQIQSAGVQLWPLGIELKGIEIGAPKDTAFGRAPLFELPSLVFKADLSELLKFKLRIKEIRLDDMKLRYEVLADGRTNIDGLSKPDTAKDKPKPIEWDKLSLPGTFKLEALKIKNASIIYIDRKAGRTLSLPELNEEMSLSLDSTLENVHSSGLLEMNSLSVEDAKLGLRKGGIHMSLSHQIKANLRKQQIQVENLKFSLQNTEIALKAMVEQAFGAKPMVDLSWQTNRISLDEVLQTIPKNLSPELAKITLAGQLQSSGRFKTTPNKPEIALQAELAGLKLSHSDVPVKIQNLGFKLKTDAQNAEVKDFKAQIDGQELDMALQAQNLQSQPYLNALKLNAHLDLGALMKLAAKFTTLPEDYQVQGRLDAALEGSGPMQATKAQDLKMQGSFQLQNLRIKAPQLPEILEYTGQIQVDNKAMKQSGFLKLGSTQMQQEASVQNYMALALNNGASATADLKINAPELDLDKLMAMFGSTGSTPASPAAAPSNSPSAYPSLPQNLNAKVQIQVGKAIAMGAQIQNFNAQLSTTANQVQGSWKAGIFGGQLNQDLQLLIQNPQMAQVKTSFNALGVDAEQSFRFLSSHLGDAPLHRELKKMQGIFHGTASIRADLAMSGSPADLSKTADGKLSIETNNGRIDPCPQTIALTSALNKAISTLQTWAPGVKEIQQLKAPNALTFNTFKSELYLNHGNFEIRDWNYEQNGLGLLLALGQVGLDTKLNMNLDYLVPAVLSKKILDLQKSALDAAGKLNPLRGLSLPADLSAFPTQKDRVLLPFIIGGTFAQPVIQLDRNKMKAQSMDLKGALQGLLKAKADSLKALGLAKLNEEKNKLKAQADQAKNEALAKAKAAENEAKARMDAAKAEAERRANEEKQKAQNKAKQEVQNKAQDALKKFGF